MHIHISQYPQSFKNVLYCTFVRTYCTFAPKMGRNVWWKSNSSHQHCILEEGRNRTTHVVVLVTHCAQTVHCRHVNEEHTHFLHQAYTEDMHHHQLGSTFQFWQTCNHSGAKNFLQLLISLLSTKFHWLVLLRLYTQFLMGQQVGEEGLVPLKVIV